jgi:hypothetical protein
VNHPYHAGLALTMGWTKTHEQCPCSQCYAALPAASLKCERTRVTHLQRYGLPKVVDDEEEVHVEQHVEEHVEEHEEEKRSRRVPVPPPSEVDEVAFAKDVVLLVVNHGMPWKSVELLMKVVNSHVHGRFVGNKLPASVYQLKKITQCSPGTAKLLHVCARCDYVFVGDATICEPCGLPPSTRVQRQLMVNDISVTLQEMFNVPSLAQAFEYACHRQPGNGDVWDGRVLRDVPLGTCLPCLPTDNHRC